ncbi:MAG: dihydroorotase [Rhodospirillaceae bacterium]|nr:MAG: dihydroorotase [Rhodospirillaceae bacterium]
MSDSFDLVIGGGMVFTPGGPIATDVGVREGRIAAFGNLTSARAAERLEARGLTVLPGVIDEQVHFREPGPTHKEDLESGTRGAVLGGVTTVFEMPNTDPPTTTATLLAEKVTRASGRAWTDFAFYVGASPENADELGVLERLPGCCGIKMFMGSSTGSLLVADDENVARVLRSGTRRVTVHSEDDMRLSERSALVRDGGSPAMHPEWRDVETALRSTKRLIALARAARRRVHVLHVTTAEELEFLAQHKDIATVEVLPQHLTLVAPDCYERLGTFAQMNPPIRDARHRDALWRAISDGVVDCIGSDHAPHTREEKARPYPRSPSGLTGVQTTVPIMLDHVAAGRLSLARFVDLTSTGPARIFGMANKGRMAVGYDADFTLVDLAAKRTITHAWIASRAGWTAFDGMAVTGWPMATIIRGRVVMRDGELAGTPQGQAVRFLETL